MRVCRKTFEQTLTPADVRLHYQGGGLRRGVHARQSVIFTSMLCV